MSEETTNVSKQRILKSLKYLVLTAVMSIGATGISSADPFTFTASGEVCDTSDRTQDTIGTLDGVVFVESPDDLFFLADNAVTILGYIEPSSSVFLPFELDVSPPQRCDLVDSVDSGDYIDVYSDLLRSFKCDTVFAMTVCDAFTEDVEVELMAPPTSGAFDTTIVFTYTAF